MNIFQYPFQTIPICISSSFICIFIWKFALFFFHKGRNKWMSKVIGGNGICLLSYLSSFIVENAQPRNPQICKSPLKISFHHCMEWRNITHSLIPKSYQWVKIYWLRVFFQNFTASKLDGLYVMDCHIDPCIYQ